MRILVIEDDPTVGQYVKRGLEGKTVSGMAFNLWGGRVTWDRAGKGP